jgi:hypothetical protein
MICLVDQEDYEYLSGFAWRYGLGYAKATDPVNGKTILMHRLVNKTPPGKVTDHKNRNRLDNRKENLRTVMLEENPQNRRRNQRSLLGAAWHESSGRWSSRTTYRGVEIFLGHYSTAEDAATAYRTFSRLIGRGILDSIREYGPTVFEALKVKAQGAAKK